MKKTIVFSLGFALLAAGFSLPLMEASPRAYHAYITQPQNFVEHRRHTEGLNANLTRRMILRNAQRTNRYGANQLRLKNYRGSREAFNRGAVGNVVNRQLMVRPSTNRIAPNTQRTVHTTSIARPVITPTVVQQVQSSLYTYENDAFSLLLPKGWTLRHNAGGVHMYTNPDSSYMVRVKKYDSQTCGTGFVTCAAQLGKAENYRLVGGSGKLEITSRILRDSRQTDTVLNRLAIMTDTYTERFNAYIPFVGSQTFNRYFVSTGNGGAFMVEAVANVRDAGQYTETTKRIFDSFRVYPQ